MHYEPLKFDSEEILEYLRKSRSDDPLLSVEEVLEKHEIILNEWSERNLDSAIPEENVFREVVSGETIADRPEMKNLLKMIESPKYKAILCVEVQRLSRGDLEDAGRIIKILRYTNTVVITPQKTYNLSDEYDRDAFERELKRGNEFLEYQKKIMGRGRLLSVSQGNFIGSVPPYGFKKVFVLDGKRKCPTLQENAEEADVIRMIFDLYVNQNLGNKNICNKLDELHVKPPKGKYWSAPAIKDMLSNVHYIGKVKWNWRKTLNVIEDGELQKTRPKSKMGEYLIYEGKHEGIVSEELFNAAQEKRRKNHRAKAKTKVRNPFAGLLFCKCGRAMSLRIYKKKDGSERSAPRLLCDGQTHCNTGSCLYSELSDYVCQVLQQCIDDFEIRLNNDDADSTRLHEKMIKNLNVKLEELNHKEISQWEKYTEEGMPKAIFDKLNEKVLAEKEEIQSALKSAYESTPDIVDYKEKIKRFSDALESLKSNDVSPLNKNRLLKTCIERMEYTKEKPVRLKGVKGKNNGLKVGGNWSNPKFELEVKLRV